MSFQEILQVKDDILKNNRELEEKIKSHIDIYGNKFKQDINSFSNRIQKVTDNNNNIVKSLPDINFKLSKIEQIEKFNARTEHKMASFEVRISTILEQIEKIKTKYDKIILDNLFVSGHIGGEHCQYSNLSEYLITNINDVNLLKLEKDQLKKEIKTLKTKHDNTVKQTVNLIDSSVNRCNQYTDSKQKDFQALLDTRMREFNEKIMEIRMNVCKIQMQTEDAVNNLNIGFDKMKEENKFFTNDLTDKFTTIQKEFVDFKNEYKSKLNFLNKENTYLKKENTHLKNETQNIKENIESMLRLIEYQSAKNEHDINDIRQYFNESVEDVQKKKNILKGSNLSIINSQSHIKNQFQILSPQIKKTKKKLLNSINGCEPIKNNDVKRNRKKRNTVAYTAEVFNAQIRKHLKENIKENKEEESRVKSPKFLGLFTPILKNIVNYKEDDKSEKGDKSFFGRNGENFEFNSTIKSNQSEEKKSNNSKTKKNKKNKNNSNSNKSNNSNSKSESESESNTSSSVTITVSITNPDKIEEEEENQVNIKIRRSGSKKNFTKLTLRGAKKKTSKVKEALKNIHIINNNNNNNNKNENKKHKRRGSVGIFCSANIIYKNNDISEIISRKFTKNKDNNKKNLQINNEIYNDSNRIKSSFNEDSKTNYIKNSNNLSPQKDKNYMINNNNNQKARFVNLLNNSNKNKLINNNIIINNQNPLNLRLGNSLNNQYNNKTIDTFSNLTKNQKRNYILTPTNDDPGIGYKINSIDIPENTNLPPRVNQLYSLNGKKIKQKPSIKPDYISPLDALYKQQYKKKIKNMKNLSNSNMAVNNGNDIPKKLLPIFGRTAYAFYNKKEKDGGINLTNSVDSNKNKNTINNCYPMGRNFNFNSIQMNNINSLFNIKTFPKIKKNFNTEKNEG